MSRKPPGRPSQRHYRREETHVLVRACPILFEGWPFGQRSVMDSREFAAFPSDLGWMALSWQGPILVELTFGHRTQRQATRALRSLVGDPTSGDAIHARRPPATSRQRPAQDRLVRAWIARLQGYASGDGHDDWLDIAVDLSRMTAFQRAVVHHCRRIPRGTVVSYGELARRAGYPGAARAVGQVMATNRVPLVVPCHRVVAVGGRLGGYSAPQGLAMKQRLLALEGVTTACQSQCAAPDRMVLTSRPA